jgi:hypothetical protein
MYNKLDNHSQVLPMTNANAVEKRLLTVFKLYIFPYAVHHKKKEMLGPFRYCITAS